MAFVTPPGPAFAEPGSAGMFMPKIVTVLREGYGARDLRADAIAGLTVAIVALPLSMAIAIASGVSPDRGIYTAIIGGFIIGALARLVMPGKQNLGCIMTTILGIAGSALGSWVCYKLGYDGTGKSFEVIPFLVGVIVAAVLIAIYLGVTGRKVRS